MLEAFEEYMGIKNFKDMIARDGMEEAANNFFKVMIRKPLKEIDEYISEDEEIKKISMIVVNDYIVNIIIFNDYNREVGICLSKYLTLKIQKEFRCKKSNEKFIFRTFILNFFETDESRSFIEVTN